MQKLPERLADVAVDCQYQKLNAVLQRPQCSEDSCAGCAQPRMFRIAGPAKCDGEVAEVVETDFLDCVVQLGRNSLTIEVPGIHRDMHDRYIAHGQHVRIG
jgi:hypothetical protein